jgi:hypothetical protein
MQTFTLLLSISLLGCATSSVSSEDIADLNQTDPAPATTNDADQAELCATLAAELSDLLAAAQRCNVASANAWQCATWVPSMSGCAEPVASPGSDETRHYLKKFEIYAQSCPLPERACPDPATLSVGCAQGADIDGLAGRCAILDPMDPIIEDS